MKQPPTLLSAMAKLQQLRVFAVLVLLYASKCYATVYTVGGNSGWDISTDVDTWSRDKTFAVGDTLLFQYSQYHSVSEVTKQNYERCNTSNVLQSSSNGNTSFALTAPGDRYFVCGNRLHCLGGMKLHVHVAGDQVASPIGAPQAAQPGGAALPAGSSKSNNNPSSSSDPNLIIRMDTVVVAFFAIFVMSFGMI